MFSRVVAADENDTVTEQDINILLKIGFKPQDPVEHYSKSADEEQRNISKVTLKPASLFSWRDQSEQERNSKCKNIECGVPVEEL